MNKKQPVFIISKASLFEAWLVAKRRSDKNSHGWDWGKLGDDYLVLPILQEIPEKIRGYVTVAELNNAIEPLRCHFAYPRADSALNSILSEVKSLRENLFDVQARMEEEEKKRPQGYFCVSFASASHPKHPEIGYVIRQDGGKSCES